MCQIIWEGALFIVIIVHTCTSILYSRCFCLQADWVGCGCLWTSLHHFNHNFAFSSSCWNCSKVRQPVWTLSSYPRRVLQGFTKGLL